MKKSISPLIATSLLIGFIIVLIALVITWIGPLFIFNPERDVCTEYRYSGVNINLLFDTYKSLGGHYILLQNQSYKEFYPVIYKEIEDKFMLEYRDIYLNIEKLKDNSFCANWKRIN